RELQKIVVVDSHGSLSRFQGVTALTPNQPEAELSLGMTISTAADLDQAGQRLLEGSHAQGVLITRGAEGMSLFEAGKTPLHLPIHPLGNAISEIVDTNGAGDTVAATFTLALTTGASMAEAAYIANAAAALVVRRLGCASNTPEELMRVIA
ncbi:MAG TPA: PfkB family carbohydrate kinase, partial [Ktedonobacteraceae bacterium]